MVCKPGTVKGNFFNTGSLGLFSHALANNLSCGNIAALARSTQGGTNFGFCGRCTCQNLVAIARNDAGLNMQIGTCYRQTGDTLGGDPDTGLTGSAQTLFFFAQHGAAPYFFLVSLIVIFSSE